MKKRDESLEERVRALEEIMKGWDIPREEDCKNDPFLQAYYTLKALKEKLDGEQTFDDDYNLEPEKKIPSGRKSVVPMCLTVREKQEFESVTARYIKEARCHIPSKSAFLRYLWRYFLKNRDDIDLSEYVD